MLSKVQKVIAVVSDIGIWVAVSANMLMIMGITANVGARELGKGASLYVEEYSGYLLVLIGYFALAYTLRTGGHIRVELLVKRLSPQVGQTLELVTTTACLAMLWVLLTKSIGFALFSLEYGVFSPHYSQSPMWIFHLFVPIGLGMFALQMVEHFIGLVAAVTKRATKSKMPT